MVAVASGPPDADPSTARCIGPEAETVGSGDRGMASGEEGDSTGFSVLRELCCLLAGGAGEKMDGTASGRR